MRVAGKMWDGIVRVIRMDANGCRLTVRNEPQYSHHYSRKMIGKMDHPKTFLLRYFLKIAYLSLPVEKSGA